MKIRLVVILMLILILFAGCADDHAGVQCEAFLEELEASGVVLTRVEDLDHHVFTVGSQSYFSVLPTRADTEAKGRLTIWEYNDAEKLEKDMSGISEDGYGLSSPEIGIATEYEFISRPHWFRNDDLIILYTAPPMPAEDPATLAAIRKAVDKEFAGG